MLSFITNFPKRSFRRPSHFRAVSVCASTPSPAATPQDVANMRLALAQARLAFGAGEVPVGAVLTSRCGATVLAAAHNAVEADADVTSHAELLTIRRAMRTRRQWRLLDTTLYCTLEPCAMCLSALALARVPRIVYGAPDLRIGACGSWVDLAAERHPFHEFEQVVGGVLADESAELLRSFFRGRRSQLPRFRPPDSPS